MITNLNININSFFQKPFSYLALPDRSKVEGAASGVFKQIGPLFTAGVEFAKSHKIAVLVGASFILAAGIFWLISQRKGKPVTGSNPITLTGNNQEAITKVENTLQQCLLGNAQNLGEQELDHTLEAIHLLIQKISKDAKRDLFLDSQERIEASVGLTDLYSKIPEEKKQAIRDNLKNLLIKECFTREMRQKGHLVSGQSYEVRVLQCLAYTVPNDSPYYNKEALYRVIQKVINFEIEQNLHELHLREIKPIIKKYALKARLEALDANISLSKFTIAYEYIANLLKKLRDDTKAVKYKVENSHEKAAVSPKLKKKLESVFKKYKGQFVGKYIKNSFNDRIKEDFKDRNVDETTFKNLLDGLEYRSDSVTTDCAEVCSRQAHRNKNIQFLERWIDNLKCFIQQGLDSDQETLGMGICLGMCMQILSHSFSHPKLSADQFVKFIGIEAKARFFQAAYESNSSFAYHPSDQILKVNKLKRGTLGAVSYYEPNRNTFSELLTSVAAESKKSFGWIDLGLVFEKGGAHAILTRVDGSGKHLWVFDPNVGFFCFEQDGIDFFKGKEKLYQFLEDLIATLYPDTCEVFAFQIAPDTP